MKPLILTATLALLFSSCTRQETEASDSTSAAPVAAGTAYPLDVCLVSGEPLGSMGDPVVITHEGREIKFCCDACIPSFEEDPAKYLSRLETPPTE